jgi:hypothetical protein
MHLPMSFYGIRDVSMIIQAYIFVLPLDPFPVF